MVVSVVLPGLAVGQPPLHWLAHDMQRPRPAVVSPGKLALPAPPPSDAIILFDGKDLSKWRDAEGGPAKWKAQDGYMESVPGSGYVFSAEKFGDIQLHVEWATPSPGRGHGQGRGNSGVFLMGLYEVQVLDSYQNDTYPDGQAGAVYGQYPPLVNVCLPPGEWQCFDIVFRRPRFEPGGMLSRPARTTVLQNGVLVQDNVEVVGPTAWLQHFPEDAHPDKLPISLQDHGNPVRYRNIWLRELVESDASSDDHIPRRAIVELSSDELKKFVGNYGSPLGSFGSIKLTDRQLKLHMKMGQVIDLLPLSPTEFAFRLTAARLVFSIKPSGEVTGFTMHLAGEKYPIAKLP